METGRKTLVVDLGEQLRVVEEFVQNGSYSSPDEVIQAALRALEREEADTNAWLMEIAKESLADPGPDIPAEEVFAEIYAIHRAGKTDSGR